MSTESRQKKTRIDNQSDEQRLNGAGLALQDSCELFKVLGDETRMRVICTLLRGEVCVHELAGLVGMSQSAISHQLRVLRQARLVRYRRAGRHTYYALADDHVRQLVKLAFEHVIEQQKPDMAE